MRLDRIYLFLTVSDPSFNASEVYDCLGVEPIDYGDSDMVGIVPISNPAGSAKIETYPCAAEDDHAFHITIDYRPHSSETESGDGRMGLNQAIDCVLSKSELDSPVPVETGLLFPKPDYISVVYERRESFKHEKIDDKIKLTGVDLDFSDSDFPLIAARVSERRRDVLVVLRRRRPFEVGRDHYVELLKESDNLASTFVRLAKPETEIDPHEPKQEDE